MTVNNVKSEEDYGKSIEYAYVDVSHRSHVCAWISRN